MPHLLDCGRYQLRQALAAVFRILGQAIPPVLGEATIGVLESGSGLDLAAFLPCRAFAVTDRVERIEHLGRELRRFLEYRRHGVGRGVLVPGKLADLFQPGELVHHELYFLHRRAIGAHVISPVQ